MTRPSGVALTAEESQRLARIDALVSGGSDPGPALIAMLTDPSWAVRRGVVSALASLGDAVVPSLCETLRTRRDDEARIAATVDALAASTGPATDERVAELAFDPNPAVISDCAQILGRRRAAGQVPLLVELSRHPDDNVAVSAIEALGRVGGRAAIDSLVETIRGGGFFRSFPAIDVLGRSGDPRAVAPLAELLDRPHLAPEAARALGRSGERSAVAPLAGLLLHASDAMVRVAASALCELEARHAARLGDEAAIAEALAAVADPARVRRLVQALAGADIAEQAAIAHVLGVFGGAEAITALSRMLDGDATVAIAAARALGRLAQAAEAELLDALERGDSARRLVLLPLIGRSGVPLIVRCLGDQDPAVRVAACDALARIGATTGVAPLFKLLADPDPRVVQAAVAAIQALGGSDAERLALESGRAPWPTVRRAAVRIAAYFGWRSALSFLVDAVRDADPRVREAAVQGLPFIEDPRALDELLAIVKDENPRLRATGLRALGQCRGDLRVAAALLRALGDADAWARYYACQSLGRLGIETATAAIAGLLQDPAGQVRVAAIEALSHLRGEQAFEALRGAAASADADVRRAALVGLGISRRPEAEPLLVEAISSPDAATRLVAVSAIADFEDSSAVLGALGRAVRDTDDAVRNAAVGFLASRPGAEATAILVDALGRAADPERVVAALATPAAGRIDDLAAALGRADDERAPHLVAALARMHLPAASAALVAALSSPNPAARRAAASAVAVQPGAEAAQALRKVAVSDPDPGVRRVAALLLGG
jgi:HEAT repeat protein